MVCLGLRLRPMVVPCGCAIERVVGLRSGGRVRGGNRSDPLWFCFGEAERRCLWRQVSAVLGFGIIS